MLFTYFVCFPTHGQVRFLRNDTRVVSAGGNDCSVFVWKHRYAVGSIVDGVELDEDDPEKLVITTMEEIMALEAAEIEDCFKGKEAEEAEDAMRREGLDADYDLDALKHVISVYYLGTAGCAAGIM